MQPAYYEDFDEIKNKIWSMLENAIKDRSSPFRIPVFICGDQENFDGRIVVLRKSDRVNNLVQYHSDIRSDKITKLKINKKLDSTIFASKKLYFVSVSAKLLENLNKIVKSF